VRGRARTLLECERVSLNFLQRLSGVATAAAMLSGLAPGRTAVTWMVGVSNFGSAAIGMSV